eukprot:scaffold61991_cov30-Tisochrysis_lutea.AAC.1
MRPRLSRQQLLHAALLQLAITPPAAYSEDLATSVRRAIVRSAQIADQVDGVWQQLAGEVVPAWQRPQTLSKSNIPPALLDEEFARSLLAIPLEVGAQCSGLKLSELQSMLPRARREAVLLYEEAALNPARMNGDSISARLNTRQTLSMPGTATRGFQRSLSTAVQNGESVANSTLFNFEAFCTWRVLQMVLSESRQPAERKKLQQCFNENLGAALLAGPLARAPMPKLLDSTRRLPRGNRSLVTAVEGCGTLLHFMQQRGLFSRYESSLQGMGSGTDLFDEGDWQAGGSTLWTYLISGSTVVGASQLAQDRTAATGLGAGLYPGQLITAPISSYLQQIGIAVRIDEYFLDNRVGRPDPRTFADPSYYSDVLLEVLALASD